MKLWLDDVRDAPDDTWVVARTVRDAIEILLGARARGEEISALSLDYDMGMTCKLPHDDAWQPIACNHTNGYHLVSWMQVYGFKARRVFVHTQNPEGRKRLLASAPLIGIDPVAVCIPAAEFIPPQKNRSFVFMGDE